MRQRYAALWKIELLQISLYEILINAASRLVCVAKKDGH